MVKYNVTIGKIYDAIEFNSSKEVTLLLSKFPRTTNEINCGFKELKYTFQVIIKWENRNIIHTSQRVLKNKGILYKNILQCKLKQTFV